MLSVMINNLFDHLAGQTTLQLLAVPWNLNQDPSWAPPAVFNVKATMLSEIMCFPNRQWERNRIWIWKKWDLVLTSKAKLLTSWTPSLICPVAHQWDTMPLKLKTGCWDWYFCGYLWLWAFFSEKCVFLMLPGLGRWKMVEPCMLCLALGWLPTGLHRHPCCVVEKLTW